MRINEQEPGQELYLKVKAGFVMQGKTFTNWCRENDVNPTNAKSALIGAWNGPKGRQLRETIVKHAVIPKGSDGVSA